MVGLEHPTASKRVALSVLVVVLAVGCGSSESGSGSAREADPGVAPADAQTGSTQYAVVYEATPFGDICKPEGLEGVTKELLSIVQDAGLQGRIEKSDAYAGQEGGGSCVELGRYGSREAADSALEGTQGSLEDPELTGGDGYPAKVVEVVNGDPSP